MTVFVTFGESINLNYFKLWNESVVNYTIGERTTHNKANSAITQPKDWEKNDTIGAGTICLHNQKRNEGMFLE